MLDGTRKRRACARSFEDSMRLSLVILSLVFLVMMNNPHAQPLTVDPESYCAFARQVRHGDASTKQAAEIARFQGGVEASGVGAGVLLGCVVVVCAKTGRAANSTTPTAVIAKNFVLIFSSYPCCIVLYLKLWIWHLPLV